MQTNRDSKALADGLAETLKVDVGRKRMKKGEVVEPAGGETGVPRCLAEVRKLLLSLIAALYSSCNRCRNITFPGKSVK